VIGATSRVYAADGTRLGFIQANELRTPITAAQIPDNVREATIAVEDRRFYAHRGVDFEGVVRAAVKNLESGDRVQGGSTLTMQLVRNLYTGDRARTGLDGYKRKIREAKLAEDLENRHPGREGKRWILHKYVNSIPYGTVGGQTAVGIQAAARIFFNKPASELELHEAALLAGLPQAPSLYNPFLAPERARARRDDVLQRMADQGYITQSTASRAKAMDLGVRASSYYRARRENYFFDYVRQQLINKYGLEEVRRGGMRIDTTVDLDMQEAARQAMEGKLGAPGRAAAIVTIDPRNGYIRTMASTGRYADSKFNLAAQGKRQPGSTFKIMALMTALKRKISPTGTRYVSKPLKFDDPLWGPIETKTYDSSYRGSIDLVRATLSSDNSVYQQLALDLGPKEVSETARAMGITSKLNGYPAETLGGLERCCSPLEMANAYATIASGGLRNRPIAITKVTFPDGRVEVPFKVSRTRVFEDGVAYEAMKILKQNIQGGTGTNANIGCPAGGKTGTTDEFTDAWFVGSSPRMTTATWVGHPNSRISMPGVAGGTIPATIWGAYMRAVKGPFCGDFREPKTPFVSQPFFGKYANEAPTGPPVPKGEDDDKKKDDKGRKDGGQRYSPDEYESVPQDPPATQPPPADPVPPAPEPAPVGGGVTPPAAR